MLADGVDLVNIRATGEKEPRSLLLVGQRYPFCRKRQQRRGSAGQAADDQIVFAGGFRDAEDLTGRGDAPFIRDGVAALSESDSPDRRGVAILNGDGAPCDPFDRANRIM